MILKARIPLLRRVAGFLLSVFLFLPAQAENALQIVAIGDSITTGYGLENPEKESYVHLLANDLNATINNFAINGLTSDGLMENLRAAQTAYPMQAEKGTQADYILMTIGGNDLLHAYHQVTDAFFHEDSYQFTKDEVIAIFLNPENSAYLTKLNQALSDSLENFKKNFPDILEALQLLCPFASIVVQTVYDPLTVLPVSIIPMESLEGLNQVIRSYASDRVLVVDTAKIFDMAVTNTPLTNIREIDIHPTAAGHRIIYEAMKSELEKTAGKLQSLHFQKKISMGIILAVCVGLIFLAVILAAGNLRKR